MEKQLSAYKLIMEASSYKPMLGNFVSIVNYADKSENNYVPISDKAESELYHPLHLNPVFYDQDAKPKRDSREKRRAAKLLLEDPDLMKEEDLPVEIFFGSSVSDTKFINKLREKEKYEEENFTRISLTKQERLFQKRMARGELLDTTTRIGQIRKLLESSDDELTVRHNFTKKKKKKFKTTKNKKHKGSGKKKR